jgi:hypothetical protein
MQNKTSGMNLISALVIVFTMASFSFGQTFWKRTYNVMGISCIISAPDGNFITSGLNTDTAHLIKIKPNSDTIWTKIFSGDSGREWVSAIIFLPDDNFIVAGYYSYLRKVNSLDGNTIWKKNYNNIGFGNAKAIKQISGDNLLIIGGYDINNSYLLKVNYNGDTIWTKKYRGSLNTMIATSDGNYLAAGSRDTIVNPKSGSYTYFYLMKFNPDGDTIWTKIYPHTSNYSYNEDARSIVSTKDENFIVTGYSIMKINQNGDTIWTKSMRSLNDLGALWDTYIAPTRDGNYMVLGGPIIFKMKPNGDTIWTKKYPMGIGDFNFFLSTATSLTPEGDFIVATSCGRCRESGPCPYVGWFFYIVDDKYAHENSLFTFKIPSAEDSLNYTYTPLAVPSGMAISKGGTISWTPTTDSVYTEHIAVFVTDGRSKKDTLSFNVNVNSLAVPINNNPQITSSGNPVKSTGISITSYSTRMVFTIPIKTSTLEIFDIKGHLVAKLPVENNSAIWRGTNAAGRYVARVSAGKRSVVRPFVVVN